MEEAGGLIRPSFFFLVTQLFFPAESRQGSRQGPLIAARLDVVFIDLHGLVAKMTCVQPVCPRGGKNVLKASLSVFFSFVAWHFWENFLCYLIFLEKTFSLIFRHWLIFIFVSVKMSAKAIYEATGKNIVYRWGNFWNKILEIFSLFFRHIECSSVVRSPFVQFNSDSSWAEVETQHPWLQQQVNFI